MPVGRHAARCVPSHSVLCFPEGRSGTEAIWEDLSHHMNESSADRDPREQASIQPHPKRPVSGPEHEALSAHRVSKQYGGIHALEHAPQR